MYITYQTFLNYIRQNDVFSYADVSRIFSVSLQFVNYTVKQYSQSFMLDTNNCNDLQDYVLTHPEEFSEKNMAAIKKIEPNVSYFFSSSLTDFIESYFLVDDMPIPYEMALYLLNCSFLSLKQIVEKKGFLYNQQAYRFLKSKECPYLRIHSHKQQTLTRYVNVEFLP